MYEKQGNEMIYLYKAVPGTVAHSEANRSVRLSSNSARRYFGKQLFGKQFFSKQFFGKQLFGKAVI